MTIWRVASIGPVLVDRCNRRVVVVARADELERVLGGDERGDALPKQVVVAGEDDPNGHLTRLGD